MNRRTLGKVVAIVGLSTLVPLSADNNLTTFKILGMQYVPPILGDNKQGYAMKYEMTKPNGVKSFHAIGHKVTKRDDKYWFSVLTEEYLKATTRLKVL